MGLISDYIDYRLSNNLNGSVIVSGLDGSGKTTMLSSLMTKYNYHKFIYDYKSYKFNSELNDCNLYELFDRSPLIEYYTYGTLGHSATDIEKITEFNYLKINMHYYNNPMFIIYLHDLWRNDSLIKQPDWVNLVTNPVDKYIDIIEMLNKLGKHTIVCGSKCIKRYN